MDREHEITLGEGKFIRLISRQGWEFVERRGICGIVVIIAITDEGELVIVEQFRHPVKRHVIELPAGLVGDISGSENEDFAVAAQRELLEETGFEAGCIEPLMQGPSSPGMSRDQYTLFLATQLKRVHEGGGDEQEDITVHLVPLAKAHDWFAQKVTDGLLVDPKVYIGLYFAARAKPV